MQTKKGFWNGHLVEVALYVFIATLPFELIFTPIAFGLLIAIYLCFNWKHNIVDSLKQDKLALTPIILYLLAFVHLLFLSKDGFAYSKIDTQLMLLLIPILIVILKLNLSQIQNIKRVFIYAMVAFCILALITLGYNYIANFNNRSHYNFIQTSMYHFHYPYDVLYINAAYTFLIFGDKLKYLNKPLVTTLFFAIIILSGVRLGMFCFALISLFFFFKNFKQLLSFKLVLGVCATLIIGFVLIKNSRYVNDKFFDTLSKIGFNTEQYVSEIGENYHRLTLREKLWSSSKTAFTNSPNKFFGYGPNGSRPVLNEIYINNDYNVESGMNSHNQYYTTLLNNGILGLIVLLTIIIIALFKSYKANSVENAIIINLILLAFITESMLERQKGVVFFALFISLIFIENKLKSDWKSKN